MRGGGGGKLSERRSLESRRGEDELCAVGMRQDPAGDEDDFLSKGTLPCLPALGDRVDPRNVTITHNLPYQALWGPLGVPQNTFPPFGVVLPIICRQRNCTALATNGAAAPNNQGGLALAQAGSQVASILLE